MALRDWLNPDYDPMERAELPELADSPAGLATLASVSNGLAKPANLQDTDSKGEKPRISKISRISISNAPDLKKQGMHRLEIAAAGLPVTLDELAVFFADDLESFGAGEVQQAGIRQAVEWYAYRHKGRAHPKREEIPAGMVRCTDCQQDRCKWNTGYTRQSSPAWRWCSSYTAKVSQMTDYRRR